MCDGSICWLIKLNNIFLKSFILCRFDGKRYCFLPLLIDFYSYSKFFSFLHFFHTIFMKFTFSLKFFNENFSIFGFVSCFFFESGVFSSTIHFSANFKIFLLLLFFAELSFLSLLPPLQQFLYFRLSFLVLYQFSIYGKQYLFPIDHRIDYFYEMMLIINLASSSHKHIYTYTYRHSK